MHAAMKLRISGEKAAKAAAMRCGESGSAAQSGVPSTAAKGTSVPSASAASVSPAAQTSAANEYAPPARRSGDM